MIVRDSRSLRANSSVADIWSDRGRCYELVVDRAKRFGVVLIDRQGCVVDWNTGAELITGFTQEEAIGQNVSFFFTPEDLEHDIPAKELKRALRDGHSEDERWHRTKSGGRFWAVGIVSPIEDGDGNVIGFSKLFRENTLRKETETRLISANAELSQFAFQASHDLKEPLRMISLSLQSLRRKAPEGDASLDVAIEGATRMNRLIDDLLMLCSVDNRSTVMQETELNAVFDLALANVAVLVEETKAKVTRSPLPRLRANAIQLTRLIQNLLSNALKFKRDGEIPVLFFGGERVEGGWQFSLSDNGIGIDPSDAERIFEPLQRSRESHRYPGTGLGLSICRKIVERHGGRIWVESRAEYGSTFRFTLTTDLELA